MRIKMTITQKDQGVVEEYVVPASSWVRTERCGVQYAAPMLKPTIHEYRPADVRMSALQPYRSGAWYYVILMPVD